MAIPDRGTGDDGFGGQFPDDTDPEAPPVFNKFGIPLVRGYYSRPLNPVTTPYYNRAWRFEPDAMTYFIAWQNCVDCCSLCAAWNACLRNIPLRLELNGFYIQDWLTSLNFNACAEVANDSIATLLPESDLGIAFTGTFIELPWHFFSDVPVRAYWDEVINDPDSTSCTARDLDSDPETPSEQCDDDYERSNLGTVAYNPYSGFGCDSPLNPHCGMCGTHRGFAYRVVDTPNGAAAKQTEVWLDALAECRPGEVGGPNEGQPVLLFHVYLFTVVEVKSGSTSTCREQICCEILTSNEILLTAEMTLADLVGEANRVPLIPKSYNQYQDDLEAYETIVAGHNPEDCFTTPSPSFPCGPPRPSPCAYVEDPEDPEVLCKVDPECLDGILPVVPQGDEGADGAYGNYVTLLYDQCANRTDCERCPVIPNDNIIVKPKVEIAITGGGCHRNLEAIISECLEVQETNIIWSTGEVGYTAHVDIENVDPSTDEKFANVYVIVIDDRGCIYIGSATATCIECLSCSIPGGVWSGGFETEDPCLFQIRFAVASVSSGQCESAFWEVCVVNHPLVTNCPPPAAACGHCQDGIDYTPCICCTLVSPGTGAEGAVIGDWDFEAYGNLCVRARAWDQVCGCATPWLYSWFCASGCSDCGDPPPCPT